MFPSPLNLFRTGRSSSPTDQTPGSSLGRSPRASPTHADLSARGRRGEEATQPLLRLRNPNILARLTRSPPHPAAESRTAGPSHPQPAQAGNGRTIEQEVTDWKQQAMAQRPSPNATGIKYFEKGVDKRPEYLDRVGEAVVNAAETKANSLHVEFIPATSLPPSTWNLTALKELDVKVSPDLTKLSEDIANLKDLTRLSVRGSPLESLPTSIGGLPLTTLSLGGGSYEALPLGFTRLSGSLQNLEISNSRPTPGGGRGLKKLPSNLGDLKLLQNLKISSHKELAEIPASVGNLTQLQTLDLSYCPKLTGLPDLSNLHNLKTLNLSGCTGLSARPEWLTQLPRGCEVILPKHLTAQRPVREAAPRPARFQPRSPEETAQRGQKLVDWITQLQPFGGERGSGRFNLWMGAMVRRQGEGPADMGQLDAVVKAATTSPTFRAELFAFAAANVEIPRDAAGRQQPGAVSASGTSAGDAHRLLIKHRIADPQTNSRQAYDLLRQMANDTVHTSFPKELMAFSSPRPAGAGSGHVQVPKLLDAYVKTHDKEGKTIMETLRSLESKHGRSSSPDEAAAHAAAMQPLDELLRARCLAVTRQLQPMA